MFDGQRKKEGNFFDNPTFDAPESQEETATEGQPAEQEAQENPGQPNDQQAQSEPDQTGQTPQEETQKVEPQPQQQENLYAGKFKSREDLVKSLDNLGEKLGRGKVDRSQIDNMSTDQLAEIYKQEESKLGKTSDVDKTRHENEELKEELEQVKSFATRLGKYVQQLTQQQRQQQFGQPAQQQQQPGQMQRDAQGRFVSQQQQQQPQPQQQEQAPQQPQQAQKETEDMDTDKFFDKFYKDPVSLIKEIASMTDRERQQLQNNMSPQQAQQVNQAITQQEQQLNQQQLQQQQAYHPNQPSLQRQQMQQRERQMIQQKAREFIQNHEEEVNDDVKKEMVQVIRENPIYGKQSFFPDGSNIPYIYRLAKQRVAKRNVDSNPQANQGNIEAQKQTARIDSQNRRQPPQPQDPNEKMEQNIKGLFRQNKGIFG